MVGGGIGAAVGDTIAYGYDTLNRLTTKTEPTGTPSVSYSYDLVGRLIAVSDTSAGMAAAAGTGNFATTASYNARNRPTLVTWTPAAAQTTPTAASVAFTHAYDQTNRRIGDTANDNRWIAYPGGAGSTHYTANALNQYAQIGAVTPSYDLNGNLTYDGTFTYGYDAESRLVSIAQGGTAVACYAYDGLGRRKSRTVGGASLIEVSGAEGRELAEYDGSSGAVNAYYAFNPAAEETPPALRMAGPADGGCDRD